MEESMDLREALTQISEIRQQVARTETFRGYRAAPVAFSGVIAWVAAALQFVWLPNPAANIAGYLSLWIGAALLSIAVMGLVIFLHYWQANTTVTRSNTTLAVGQFAPAIVAGGLLTFVLSKTAPEALWMLPGLWSLLFSLGVFASYRLLPRPTFWIAIHYLACGMGCLAFAQGDYALSPWAMAVPFGLGQFLSAGILYWTLERCHDEN
jgi:hypothetical protein